MPAEERVDLVVGAQVNDARTNLTKLVDVLDEFGKAAGASGNTARDSAKNTGGFLGTLKQFYGAASMGAQGAQGFVNVIGSINPAAGAALNGILGLVGALGRLKDEAVQVLSESQSLVINLESLAAQELVKAGKFENAAAALDSAKLAAAGLLRQIQLLGLESPFENKIVVQTFQQGMAYGFNAEQAMKLTRASLDMAAGLGKSGAEMSMIGMVMGQMRATGKLLTQDLRQLQSRGINVADMLNNQLGVSVEQFNAGLASGKYSMDDLLDVFAEFASVNFAGAGKRMARTFQGIKATLNDLKETAYIALLKQPFDKVTAVMADGLDVLTNFVTQSGVLEKVGGYLNNLVDKAMDFGQTLYNWVQPALGIFTSGKLNLVLQDAQHWIKLIGAEFKSVGDAVWQFIKPALDWLAARIQNIDWFPILAHLKDTVNAVGAVIFNLLETIRLLLTGQSDKAFNPLRTAISYVLTWILVTWDRFAADAVTWGWNLVVQIANGIISAARGVLQTAMQVVGNFIGLFIKPGSPPKKGPLSHIVEWGRGLINTYVQAFKSADFGLLRDSLSPIQDALQAAVAAGNIDETQFASIYAGVRDDVAQLISIYRQTGEISDAVLGGISDKLGEGGAELTKYLRLQLQYQKAQDNLAQVSEEVAAAQAAGFVPKALADKLKAAQESADAAQEELNWQKEYLGLQKDSVDIQLQLVQALQKMGGALGDVADKLKKAGEGAATQQTAAPFTTNLLEGLGGGGADIGNMSEGLTGLSNALGGISKEFGAARQKVEDFLNTPLDEIVGNLVQGLEDITGLDFSNIGNFFAGLGDLSWDDISQGVADLASGAWEGLLKAIPTLMASSGRFFATLIKGIMSFISTRAPAWGQSMGTLFGRAVGAIFTFVTTQLPVYLAKLVGGIALVVYKVAEWLLTEAPRLAISWLKGFIQVIGIFLGLVDGELPGWVAGLIKFAANFISSFSKGFLENAPDWLKSIIGWGATLMGLLHEGLSTAWDMVTYIYTLIRDWVVTILARIGWWLNGILDIGKTFVKKIKTGIERAWDLVVWIGAQFINLVNKLKENAGTFLAGLLELGGMIVTKIKDGILAAWDMVQWVGQRFSEMWVDLTDGEGSGWLDLVWGAGSKILDMLKSGILNKWEGFKAWFRGLLQGLVDNLPGSEPKDPRSPLRHLARRGMALVENFRSGMDMGALNTQLRSQLQDTRRILSMAGIGLQVSQSYAFGDMVFPNVRDGRDAQGIERALSRLTLQGRMTARTQGG